MRKWILLALVCLVTSVRAEVQTNYGRIRTDGISNEQTMTGRGTPFATNTGGIMYVSVFGNDANDGLSWGSAKLTINAAICALPHGNCASSPRQAGAGTVIYQEGVSIDTSSNVGIWLAGTNDSQYVSGLPAGWMKAYATGGLNVKCGTRASPPAHQHQPGCWVGTFTAGTNKPMLWLSGTTQPVYFADFYAGNSTPVAWIGVDSTGCIAGGGQGACAGGSGQAISVTLDNISGGPSAPEVGMSAAAVIGDGYWIQIRDSSFGGNPAYQSVLTAASRTSNVVTYITSSTCNFTTGQKVSVMLLSDSTFNGTKTVASGCSGGSTFTVSQTGPNATATTGGVAAAFGDAGFGLVLESAQIEIRNIHQETGGGLKCYNNTGNAVLVLHDAYMEGSYPSTPMVWTSCGGDLSGLVAADASTMPAIVNENGSFVYARNTGGTNEPSIIGAGVTINSFTQFASRSSLLANGGSGWSNNQYFQAQMDTARRTGSPTSVRFPNTANPTPNTSISGVPSWYACISGAATITPGKTDPFGGTGAGELAGGVVCLTDQNISFSAGDTFAGGLWVRTSGGGRLPSNTYSFTLQGFGFGSGDLCTTLTGSISTQPNYYGDGNWEWIPFSCKVYAAPSVPTHIALTIDATTTTMQVFAPYVAKIPAGILSTNEIADFVNSIPGGFSPTAVAGDVVAYPFQQLCAPGKTSVYCGYISHNNTANRTYTFPDASGNVCVSGVSCGGLYASTYNTQTNCNVNSASPAACGSAPSGSVVVPTTTTWYTINTSAVTVNSRIHVWPITDNSGLTGSPTCTTPASGYFGESGRVAGTSFTFTLPSTTGTTCWTYSIVN